MIVTAAAVFIASNGLAQTGTPSGQGTYRAQAGGNQPLAPAQQHQMAQQRAAQQRQASAATQGNAQQNQATAGNAQSTTRTAPAATAPAAPFPPLSAAQEQELTRLLQAWETQSKTVQRLEADFTRWHYDLTQAPAGVHATWAKGEIRYASPDKGMFRVNELKFYKGMQEGKPQYAAVEGMFGEYWACNGQQLFDFDRGEKKCTVQDLPPELQGTQIFESPLPFVFNLDAEKIRQRYWVRTVASPKPDTVVIEAWPKRQEDRAQYRLVQIVIDPQTFLPQALLMYAPNFNAKTAPAWDHYEFSGVKKNSIIGGLQQFVDKFIEKPDSNWKVVRERYQPPASESADLQQAQAPAIRR
ncbi:TIGR03009 domain-containing protein [Roseimaritima sediminicola]|uniref:TIGR03009 domain-containing protein n=1 Tax=Roseimaritima sediminicola TaxID=2662066 RepID=UPI001EEEB77E|nr:TIGR03009 domain-containing protein [Roseimaritima sediminicola]